MPSRPAPAAGAAPASTAVAKPTYVSIPMEITVNRPAAEVGSVSASIATSANGSGLPCTITSGKDGEYRRGTIDGNGDSGWEDRAFLQLYAACSRRPTVRHVSRHVGSPPLTATTSKLVYTLMLDNSMLADDEARAKDIASKTAMFTGALENMKILAEGGTLPPAPARGGGKGKQ